MKTILEAKIEARNVANLEANRIAPILAQNFAPLVGKKIMKADGLMEKFKSLVPEMSKLPGLHQIHRYSSSSYNLAFVVRSCVSYGTGTCTYDEATVYVGELHNGVLTKLIEHQARPTSFNVQQVIDARGECQKAREVLRKAESGLQGFGEYDR